MLLTCFIAGIGLIIEGFAITGASIPPKTDGMLKWISIGIIPGIFLLLILTGMLALYFQNQKKNATQLIVEKNATKDSSNKNHDDTDDSLLNLWSGYDNYSHSK